MPFIELKTYDDDPILVNTDRIEFILPKTERTIDRAEFEDIPEAKTYIEMKAHCHHVKESYDEVVREIEKVTAFKIWKAKDRKNNVDAIAAQPPDGEYYTLT